VVAAPSWFINEVVELHAGRKAEPDDALDQIHGARVVVNDALAEPVTVTGDGRQFPVLPGWARQANRGNLN